MLQESSFARQTRRPIFSLEAGPPRETGCSSAAGHVRQPASAIHAVRMDGGSPGPARGGEPPMAQERSGLYLGAAARNIRRRNVFSQQSRVGWGLSSYSWRRGSRDHARRRLLRNPTSAKKSQGSGSGIGTMSRRCRKLYAIRDTTEVRSMASSVYGPERVFARIRRLRICQSPGRLIPGLQTDSESALRVTWRLARLRKVNLRQA